MTNCAHVLDHCGHAAPAAEVAGGMSEDILDWRRSCGRRCSDFTGTSPGRRTIGWFGPRDATRSARTVGST